MREKWKMELMWTAENLALATESRVAPNCIFGFLTVPVETTRSVVERSRLSLYKFLYHSMSTQYHMIIDLPYNALKIILICS